MSKDIYTIVKEEVVDEFMLKGGKTSPHILNLQQVIANKIIERYKIHKIKPTTEMLIKDVDVIKDRMSDIVTGTKEFKDAIYKKSYDKLKALVEEGRSFKSLITEVYQDEPHLNDIYIRLIEEKENVAITSAEQLQELSGITEMYGWYDDGTEKTKEYKGVKKPTKKEAEAEAKKELEDVFIQGMYNRYFTAVEEILRSGGEFKDALFFNPKDFNLPEQWSGTMANNKEEVVLRAIAFTYMLNEINDLVFLPNLRSIANELGAPYSVIMDAYKLFND